MSETEKNYLRLLRRVNATGSIRPTRTGINARSVFGAEWECDLRDGFPLLTTKFVSAHIATTELLWMLNGLTSVIPLRRAGVSIWDKWADADGELGPVYGAQWRNWNGDGVDQITALVKGLRDDPHSRRHLLTSWNPGRLAEMRLPPCHVLAQFDTRFGLLSCQVYQRSADLFVGVPYDIALYALLTHLLAQRLDLVAHRLRFVFGDLHLYRCHYEAAKRQLSREPYEPPQLHLDDNASESTINREAELFGLDARRIEVYDYTSHPPINVDVPV